MNRLTQKLGPLPIWVWGVIGTIGVLALYLLYQAQKGTSTSGSSAAAPFGAGGTSGFNPQQLPLPDEYTPPPSPASAPQPVGGSPSGVVAPTSTFSSSELSAPHLAYLSGNHQQAQALAYLSAPHLAYLASHGMISPSIFTTAHLASLLRAAHAPSSQLTATHLAYLENAIKSGAASFTASHTGSGLGG